MRSLFFASLASSLALFAAACGESGIGAPCDVGAGTGNLRVVLNKGSCTTSICVSYIGSPGYCTVACDTASDCPAQGYLCCPVVQTGGGNSCTTDQDCTATQRCRQAQCKPRQYCVQASGSCQ